MPTVLRVDGLRVFFYANEHVPRHVHVTDGEAEAVFNLNCPDGPIAVRDNHGFSERRLNEIRRILEPHITDLCAAWGRFFGE